MVMRWVITSRNGKNIVQFASVKSPVADELLCQLLVVALHLGNCRTESGQVSRDPTMLPFLVENEPIRVFLNHFRNDILMRFPFTLAVFHAQRQPPSLDEFAFFM